jgi:hypothetical protein
MLLAISALGASCAHHRTEPPLQGTPEAWPFRPASLVFHALSRPESAGDAAALLLRLECRDREGDPVKAVGVLSISIRCADAVPPETQHHFDLSDPAVNRALYDPVTLAYRVRIREPWTTPPPLGAPIEVAATLEQDAGSLAANLRLRW